MHSDPQATFTPSGELVRELLDGYALRWDGPHGLPHWARVLETGLRLAGETGADPEVVALFAVFHDSRRENDGWDHGHGARGARLAATLRGRAFELDDRRFDLLYEACLRHTDGCTTGDVTLRTCWDADRLDLGRVGITPVARHLCTDAARRPDTITWAERRARGGHVPEVVTGLWLPPGGVLP
ncbi:MAG: hypothetical protein RRA92_10790 [Gemmatimonadota bacterium]|nr:hypothetical protein [Gemmatimonadota bacterium]